MNATQRTLLLKKLASPGVKAKVLAEAGIIRPYSPVVLAKMGKALAQWGVGPAGGFTALAVRSGDKVGFVDELGELTYAEIVSRGRALADSLRSLGVGTGDGVAIMARNHRGFLDATLAGAFLGGDILYLNTAFAAQQLAEVLEREEPKVIIYDEEFIELLSDLNELTHVIAWSDEGAERSDERTTSEALIARGSATTDFEKPQSHSRVVILTSGTTGTPKGAPRSNAGVDAAVAILSRMPLKHGWTTHIAAPLFHAWGFAHLAMAMLLETRVVVRRKFDPEACLKAVTDHEADSLVVIPVMMQRILRLDANTLAQYPLESLKATAASGSALAGDLSTEWMDQFGDNLYNFYGSTEVAYATIANPEDLRAAPGTAGKPPFGTVVKLFDEDDNEVPEGETGRIFVGNGTLFDGYTGGGSKDTIDGLMSSGDVGHFDSEGRLVVEGRDDEMIVSGGENVFPKEIEDCLTRHEGVQEAAAIGVDDEEFGKRLRAFVVKADDSVSEDDLKAHIKSNLARYKVPREIVFIDELPRNETGKLVKRDLEDMEI